MKTDCLEYAESPRLALWTGLAVALGMILHPVFFLAALAIALSLPFAIRRRSGCLRPGATLSSLGVYSGKLAVPHDAFAAGIGDYAIVTTLWSRRQRADAAADDHGAIGSRRDGVLKVANRP